MGTVFYPKFFFSTIFKISISTIFNIVWVLFSIYSNFSTTFKISGYGFLPSHIFQQVSNFSTIIYLFIYFVGYCFLPTQFLYLLGTVFLPTIFIAAGYCFLPTQFSIFFGYCFLPKFFFSTIFQKFQYFWGTVFYPLNFQ